jgi:hypothetical protein
MAKSYSKIRHIQEINQKLEEQYLNEGKFLNTVRAGAAGAVANVGTRLDNLGNAVRSKGQKKVLKNPKLEAVVKKIKVREDYLRKQLEYLKKELDEYLTTLSEASTTTPDYKPEFDKTMAVVNQYKQSIDATLTKGDELSNYSVNYGTQTGTSTQQTAQQTNQPQ